MPFYIQYPGLWIGLLKGALWISLPCSETLKHTVWMERYAEVKCFIPFDIQWFYRSLRCPWRYKMVSKRKILWGANSCGHRKDVFKNLYLASSLSFSVETSNTTIMAHTLFGVFFRQTGKAEVYWDIIQVRSSHLGGCLVSTSSRQ